MQNGVFLTGATGFLGAHLLRELLERSDMPITCLVRGEGEAAARRTFERQLAWYFPDFDLSQHAERLALAVGDIERPLLGMEQPAYEQLAATHGVILNAAANVHHVGAASRAFRANTDGVAALIDFAWRGVAKVLHHVSTVSVQGVFAGTPTLAAFDETHLAEGQTFPGPYPESKYRAELLMRKAFEQGLRGAVYRIGFVGPHSETGRFQRNIQQHNVARYVRGAVRLGFAPFLPDHSVRLTPVDSVARGIIALLTRGDCNGRTYYVDSPHRVNLYDVVRVLHAAGYPVRLLSAEVFHEKAARLSQDEEALNAVTGGRQSTEGHVLPIDSSASERALSQLGFAYPRVSSRWLGRFVEHAIEVGFLEAPRFWNIAEPSVDLALK
jgi:fengycin family lipopeptide synthetase D